MKPFSQACENNKTPILERLRDAFARQTHVLEIGSGTGQHAVYFAEHLPHLVWQTSDLVDNHSGIQQWLNDAGLSNTRPPLALDVTQPDWPINNIDGVFTANTLHIMSWSEVESFFAALSQHLNSEGSCLAVYGPFNYHGKYTSDSNRQFDSWLREQAPHRAIRDFEAVNQLAEQAGLTLRNDFAMPSNNRLLEFTKR